MAFTLKDFCTPNCLLLRKIEKQLTMESREGLRTRIKTFPHARLKALHYELLGPVVSVSGIPDPRTCSPSRSMPGPNNVTGTQFYVGGFTKSRCSRCSLPLTRGITASCCVLAELVPIPYDGNRSVNISVSLSTADHDGAARRCGDNIVPNSGSKARVFFLSYSPP